ncbi:MAG: hypothetical protein ACK5VY_04015, partial [Alphaproteobacteria bacterium]
WHDHGAGNAGAWVGIQAGSAEGFCVAVSNPLGRGKAFAAASLRRQPGISAQKTPTQIDRVFREQRAYSRNIP